MINLLIIVFDGLACRGSIFFSIGLFWAPQVFGPVERRARNLGFEFDS
jgi:hypothetical protein